MSKANYKEIDIENFLWSNIMTSELKKRGLHLNGLHFFRQLNMPGCGIADIVSVCLSRNKQDNFKTIEIDIYELKRGVVTCDDVGQMSRYMLGMLQNWGDIFRAFDVPIGYSMTVNGFVVGAGIERDAHSLVMLGCRMNYIEFNFDWKDGILFQQKGSVYLCPINVSELKKRAGGMSLYNMARNFRTTKETWI